VQGEGPLREGLHRRRCGGCNNLGTIYSSTDCGEQDDAQAATYFEKACNDDESTACSNLASLYENGNGVSQDTSKAKQLYQKACDAGDKDACDSAQKL
jgi:hypothetical protein